MPEVLIKVSLAHSYPGFLPISILISILTPVVIPIILTLEFAALALPTFSAGGGTYGCFVLPSEASSARATSCRVSRLAQTLCGSRI